MENEPTDGEEDDNNNKERKKSDSSGVFPSCAELDWKEIGEKDRLNTARQIERTEEKRSPIAVQFLEAVAY